MTVSSRSAFHSRFLVTEIILFRRVEVNVIRIVIRWRPLYAASESCPSIPDLLADTEVQQIVYLEELRDGAPTVPHFLRPLPVCT
jgi:hypothetical protein